MKNMDSMYGRQSRSAGRDLLRGHDMRYIYSRLWRYLSRHKLLFSLAILMTVATGILSITGTSLAGKAIGAIAGEGEYNVFFYVVVMALCYTTAAVISYVRSVIMLKLTHNMVAKMRSDVYENLVELPVGFFDRRQAGEIVSTISYDVNTVSETLAHDFLQIILSGVTVVYSFVLMLTVSPTLVGVFAVTIPLSFTITTIIKKITRPLFRKRSAALGELNGYVEEMIAGHKTIKTYGREREIIEAFAEKNAKATEAYCNAEKNGTLAGPSIMFVNNLSLALVNIFGAILFINSGINLTDLSQFILLSRKFSGPINEIANIYADIQSALAASERVFHLIDEKREPKNADGAHDLACPRGKVEFKNVRFGYTKDRVILKNLNMTAEPGSVTAIVGPTGAGKTTIINLLMRFYDIDEGDILIDGESIYSVSRDSLRSAYTMVLQDAWLFHGTIYENIAYGREGVSRDEVERVCRAAGIHDFVMSLPDGYDTVISESGTNISKGQKQLLTIARAMLIDSKMLILDEATSNVDSKTERDISDAMVRLMKDRTCFVIAHRLSTIRGADNIIVVRDGDVVEQGKHDELLARGGFYSELYYSQFEKV